MFDHASCVATIVHEYGRAIWPRWHRRAEPRAANRNAYSPDLAALVLTRWHDATTSGQIDVVPPAASTLGDILSTCYQATLLREEGRPVTFRLSLSEPDAFASRPARPRASTVWYSCVGSRSISMNSEGLRPRSCSPDR